MKTFSLLFAIAVIGTAAFLARSDYWIVPSINRWQAKQLGDQQYFPAFTVFILAIPPLLLLALVHWCWRKKNLTVDSE